TSTLFPAEWYRRPRIPPPSTPAPPVSDVVRARAWLDAERLNLVASVAHTAERGWPTHTDNLATILVPYLYQCGHLTDALIIHTHALGVARDVGDLATEAFALHNLGNVSLRWGRYDEAFDLYQQALALRREVGDRVGEAMTMNNLGMVSHGWGRYGEAID